MELNDFENSDSEETELLVSFNRGDKKRDSYLISNNRRTLNQPKKLARFCKMCR